MMRRIALPLLLAGVVSAVGCVSTGPGDREPLHFVLVSAGTSHTCGIVAAGDTYCWGDNAGGQLGTHSKAKANPDPQLVLIHPLRFVTLSVGQDVSCGLVTNGRAYCWGLDGVPDPQPLLAGTTFASLVVGAFVCGMTTDGHLRCGDFAGTSWEVTMPSPFVQIGVGALGCGLTAVGEVWCWGKAETNPVQSSGTAHYISLADNGTCGVVDDGSVRCSGSTIRSSANFATSLTIGGRHGCGLSATGTAMCWGEATSGQLGIGGEPPFGTIWPFPVPIINRTWTAITAGGRHTCALATDGLLYCWGANQAGEVGDGTTILRPSPVRVARQTEGS